MKYTVTYHKPGDTAKNLRTGDFILTRGNSFYSKAIRFGQTWGGAKLSEVNHACLSIGGSTIVEALGNGVVQSDLSWYENTWYAVIHVGMSEEDVTQVNRFVGSVLEAKTGYGWVHIASIILALLTNTTLFFGVSETEICSGFVASALTRAGYVWPKPPSFMMPSDLADYFGVDLPLDESVPS